MKAPWVLDLCGTEGCFHKKKNKKEERKKKKNRAGCNWPHGHSVNASVIVLQALWSLVVSADCAAQAKYLERVSLR